jgi:MFS transporter, SET family, sugar efflux transporter
LVTAEVRHGSVVGLAVITAMIGLGGAMLAPTTSLFLADAVRVTPLMIGLFFAGRSVLEVGTDLVVGALSDKIGNRRAVLALCLLLSAIGSFLYIELRNYYALFAVGVVFYGIGGSNLAQQLAFTREFAENRALNPTFFNSAMRSINSASWIFGPAAGFWLIGAHGFPSLFFASGMIYLIAAIISFLLLPNLAIERGSVTRRGNPYRGLDRATLLIVAAVMLLLTINIIYQIDISLFVVRDLHFSAGFTGLLLGVGAALEVPVLLSIGGRAERLGLWRLLIGAACCAILFFCALPLATTKAELLVLQIPNAIWTALALSIPVILLQNIVPAGRGTVSSLYSGALKAGIMTGGATAGVAAEWAGYAHTFWVCAALAAMTAALLFSQRNRGSV